MELFALCRRRTGGQPEPGRGWAMGGAEPPPSLSLPLCARAAAAGIERAGERGGRRRATGGRTRRFEVGGQQPQPAQLRRVQPPLSKQFRIERPPKRSIGAHREPQPNVHAQAHAQRIMRAERTGFTVTLRFRFVKERVGDLDCLR